MKALIGAHSGMAYLLMMSTTISLILAIINAAVGSKPSLVRAGTMLGRKVEPALMGLIGLIGIGAWITSGLPITTAYLWIGVLAVIFQGALIGMVLKPTLIALTLGNSSARWRWVGVALVHSLLIGAMVGLMQAN